MWFSGKLQPKKSWHAWSDFFIMQTNKQKNNILIIKFGHIGSGNHTQCFSLYIHIWIIFCDDSLLWTRQCKYHWWHRKVPRAKKFLSYVFVVLNRRKPFVDTVLPPSIRLCGGVRLRSKKHVILGKRIFVVLFSTFLFVNFSGSNLHMCYFISFIQLWTY